MDDLNASIEGMRLRPNLKPFSVAVVLNLVLGILLLGGPYARGRIRAEESTEAFAQFASCFFGGEAIVNPGLGLPLGERVWYADRLLVHSAGWPERCQQPLRAIAAPEVSLIYPSSKEAESRLRSATELVATQMAALDRMETLRVPLGPLEAVSTLRSALAEVRLAADLEVQAERDAIRWPADTQIIALPSRLPLPGLSAGTLEAGSGPARFFATALNRRRVSYVAAGAQGVALREARRPTLASAARLVGRTPWLLLRTAQQTCERSGGCAQRSLGLASFAIHRARPSVRYWLQAHPLLDAGRAVYLGPAAQSAEAPEEKAHDGADALEYPAFVWVLAETATGAQLRHFELPVAPVTEDGTPQRVRSSDVVQWPGGRPSGLRWFTSNRGLRLVSLEEAAWHLWREGEGAAHSFEGLGGRLQADGCADSERSWVVVAGPEGSRLMTESTAEEPWRSLPLPASISPPDPGSVRLACWQGAVEVLTLKEGVLSVTHCDVDGCAPATTPFEEAVAAYDVVVGSAGPVLAWSGRGNDLAIRVSRSLADGWVTLAPAPCWEPRAGLCGPPHLLLDEGGHHSSILLYAVDEVDLRVMRSTDGTAWSPLSGLTQY